MVWIVLKEIDLLAGITRRVWQHLLTHAMATDLLRGGADLRVIQELLGHETISTTESYLRLDASYLTQGDRKPPSQGVRSA
jgi:integrase/recombinase XerD